MLVEYRVVKTRQLLLKRAPSVMERNNDEKKAILSITYVEIRSLEK